MSPVRGNARLKRYPHAYITIIKVAANILLFLKNIYHSPNDIERYKDEYKIRSILVYIVEIPNIPAIIAIDAIAKMGKRIHRLMI